MQPFPTTLVWRHRRENLKKCSLRGLEKRLDIKFFSYPNQPLPSLENYIVLDFDGPLLTAADADKGLLILDGTWKYASKMLGLLPKRETLIFRSLPKSYRTAYPRRQEDCSEPERGLASIEALYVAYHILGRNTEGLLDHYYWQKQFLEINGLVA